MGLNPQQLQAVETVNKPVLVLAGAGSGKTSVITQKIAWLIQQSGYASHNIAAVTFTNKAAKEMKERVKSLLSGINTRGLIISTFHSLGLTIIRRELKHLNLKSGFSIFDREDSLRILKGILLDNEADKIKAETEFILNLISHWKNKNIDFKQAMELASNQEEQRLALIYQRYEETLQAYNSMDFDDLILKPLRLFKNNNDVLTKWQRQIRYLLVDEFQDTNHTQYQLVQLLTSQHQGMTAVGDDDQSIYAWRGAQSDNLLQLQSDYPQLELIKLEQNYRSTNRILQAANQLIGNNPRQIEKRLWSKLGDGDPIRVVRRQDEFDELQWIVSDLQYRMVIAHRSYGDFAILYRSNHQSRHLETQLQTTGTPYKVSGGTSFYARTEIKDIMAYLRLVLNPDDNNALLRIINTPRRQIGSQTLFKLGELANQTNQSIYQLLTDTNFNLQSVLNHSQLTHLETFKSLIEKNKKLCERGEPIKAVKELLDDINYLQWLHNNSASAKMAEKRYENVCYLINGIEKAMEYADDEHSDTKTLFEQVINKMLLMDVLDNQEQEQDDNQVHLLTLHACKGLEFKEVYLMGVEENILPHYNSIEAAGIEEERRLFYVGMTRARENLCLTLTKSRNQYGENKKVTASRFIDELPDDIKMMGMGEQKQASQQQVDEAFNDILKLLKT